MTKIYQNRRIAYTIFCDDIRQEVDQKFSAIGIYQTAMVLTEEVQTLSKLVAFTVIELPPDAAREGWLALMDGEAVLVEGKFVLPEPPGEEGSVRALLSMPVVASPFDAKVGMELQVRFKAGDHEYRSSVLSVVCDNPVVRVDHTQWQPAE